MPRIAIVIIKNDIHTQINNHNSGNIEENRNGKNTVPTKMKTIVTIIFSIVLIEIAEAMIKPARIFTRVDTMV